MCHDETDRCNVLFRDDFLRIYQPRWCDKRRHLSDAEVLTTALLAVRFFGGNLSVARRYM